MKSLAWPLLLLLPALLLLGTVVVFVFILAVLVRVH